MITWGRSMFMTILLPFAMLPISSLAQTTATKQDGSPQNDIVQMREQQRRRQEELNRRLNFTPEQKQQWVLIQKQTAQQIKAARMDESLNEEQMQEKIRAIHKQNRTQVLAMLTPEQQAELKKWWEEQRLAKQQPQGAKTDADSSNSDNSSGNTSHGKADTKDDDFFAGMIQDPEPPQTPAKKH